MGYPMTMRLVWCLCLGLSFLGCDGPADPKTQGSPDDTASNFTVREDTPGLLFTYFDEDGVHTTSDPGSIPEDRRDVVRVKLLDAEAPSSGPGAIWVANLGEATDGMLHLTPMKRSEFDAKSDAVVVVEEVTDAVASSDEVIIYGADWCGACRSAAALLRKRGVPFVEKNIEKDAGARREMNEKLKRAGLQAKGIPVIDFRGHLLRGYSERQLDQLIRQGAMVL